MPLGIFACKTLTLSQLFSFFKEQLGASPWMLALNSSVWRLSPILSPSEP